MKNRLKTKSISNLGMILLGPLILIASLGIFNAMNNLEISHNQCVKRASAGIQLQGCKAFVNKDIWNSAK